MTNLTVCPDYSWQTLKALPDTLWEGLPAVAGKRVFIKPNLVVPPKPSEAASCTHKNIVRLLTERCLDGGADSVSIGDCGFKGQWEETMRWSGLPDLPKRYGDKVRLIPLQDGENFHKYTLIRFDTQNEYMSLFGVRWSDFLLEAEVVINVPKMKMHQMALTTGAIKNMMGTMAQKGSMHPRGCHHTLHKRLRDLYFLLKDRVHWVLMDGVVGSEYAEHMGVPRQSGVLLSSTDMWDVDCTAARLMGVPPSEVPYLRYIAASKPEWPTFPGSWRRHIQNYERPLAYRS